VDAVTIFLSGLGVAMFLEGLPYFISPNGVRRYLGQIQRMPNRTLRVMGFLLMGGGLLVAWASLR
jgi:uncharacterized protein YjeT (DUF2065 family)